MSRFTKILSAATAVLALSASGAASAHRGEGKGEKISAVQRAKVSLSDAIDIAERASGARVAKIEIDREEGAFVYEIKAVSNEAKVKLVVDSTSGKVLRNERKDASQKDRTAVTRLAGLRTTLAQAVQAAEQKGAGQAVAAGIEDEEEHRNDAGVYEVDVAANGAIQRVWIDAASGQAVASPSPDEKRGHDDDEEDDD
jgi:uncharacterized membrane protein YkoI